MRYGQQGCKTAIIGLLACMLLVACTRDNATDSNALPDGKYPVTFTATGLQVTPATRATADDTWDGNDVVAVRIGTETKKYEAETGGTSCTLKAANNETPFYWQSTDETKNVSAWYLGTYNNNASNPPELPGEWSVQTDQSSYNGDGYQKSDFLYAKGTIDFKGTKSLTFYHQTAKVVINIRDYGVAESATNISVTIKAITKGTFSENANEGYRLYANGSTYTSITPKKLIEPNKSVDFGGRAETALASYQALVIPQTPGSSTPIEITINRYTFKYTPTIPSTQSGTAWKGGTQYTYNLTVGFDEITATVTTSNIDWGTNGASGEGSVEIQ